MLDDSLRGNCEGMEPGSAFPRTSGAGAGLYQIWSNFAVSSWPHVSSTQPPGLSSPATNEEKPDASLNDVAKYELRTAGVM